MDHYAHAFFGQFFGDLSADPAAAARDQRAFPLKLQVHERGSSPSADIDIVELGSVSAEDLEPLLWRQLGNGFGKNFEWIGIEACRMWKVGLEHDVVRAKLPDSCNQAVTLEECAAIDVF